MKKIGISLIVIMSATFLISCGGESETSNDSDNEEIEDVEETTERPQPEIISSGSTMTLVHGTKNPQSNYEHGYDCIYTILDYTTNVDFSKMPVKEYSEPGDQDQIFHITIQAEMTSLTNYNFKSPANGFDLVLEEGGDDMFEYNGFTDEFKDGLMVFDDLELNAIDTMEIYFRIPIDTDLSNAYLDLYLGSDMDAMQLSLNPQ